MQQPPLIKYNLTERGRQYRGAERHWDIPRIVDSINGPATQERVKTRGMLGFFGHWPRLKFGLEPAEGGIAEGRAQAVEPAVVTVHLAAFDDGTVEHQTEFLDTSTGQLAARMHANRVGGFSSAIDPTKPELFGFDYVNDPNYSTNRGYDLLMDSVTSVAMTFDDIVLAEQVDQLKSMNALFAAMEASLRLALDSTERLERENNDLMDMLAARDRAAAEAAQAPLVVDTAARAQIERDRRAFRETTNLPQFKTPDAARAQIDREYQRLRNRMMALTR